MFVYDLYVMSEVRQSSVAGHFLSTYAKDMEEAAVDYPIPQHADRRRKVYDELMALIDFLVANPAEPYSLYFSSRKPDSLIRSAMLFFTTDGFVIAGLTVACGQDRLREYLQGIADCVGGGVGYTAVESPPPLSKVEFLMEVDRCSLPTLGPPI